MYLLWLFVSALAYAGCCGIVGFEFVFVAVWVLSCLAVVAVVGGTVVCLCCCFAACLVSGVGLGFRRLGVGGLLVWVSIVLGFGG